MLFNSYQSISDTQTPINSGSFLSTSDDTLLGKFIDNSDIWYGESDKDIVELSMWDLESNLLGWGVISGSVSISSSISYLNELNVPLNNSSTNINNGFIKFNSSKLLINPVDDLKSIGLYSTGSYTLIYSLMRNVAGDVNSPLTIKEISPSRTEIKLLPQTEITPEFLKFSNSQIFINEVYQEYINRLSIFPVSTIYNEIKPLYIDSIKNLQTIAFLNTDGDVIEFINELYEDSYTYNGSVAELTRHQGIKSYFFNYLLSNLNSLTTFDDLDSIFDTYIITVLSSKLLNLQLSNTQAYNDSITFIHDLIKIYYYQVISDKLKTLYNNVFNFPLKNVLNFGDNILLPILNRSGFLEDDGSTSLIIKLKNPLPPSNSIGDICWVSNISTTPIILNTSINNLILPLTYKIGSPDFSLKDKTTSTNVENKKYSGNDLMLSSNDQRNVDINRKIKNLNIDYSSFSNFIIFSSAEIRIKIFKNKNTQLSSLYSQLNDLNVTNQNFIALNNSSYPFYESELIAINNQIDGIIDSFDGFESYLFNLGSYTLENGNFKDPTAVQSIDTSAQEYDDLNRDSLVKNTPKYILEDTNNDDYIIFLSMIGHFFDNIYVYISNLPSAKSSGFSDVETLSQKIISTILEDVGWDITDILSDTSITDYYVTSSLNTISSIDKIKIIQNRILQNLPIIYKSKGTSACIGLLLSCYGIPDTLLNIREYGGYSSTLSGSYTFFETSYMYQFDKSSPNDRFILTGSFGASSYLLKVCIDDTSEYSVGDDVAIVGRVNPDGFGNLPPTSSLSGSGEWAIGITKLDNTYGNLYFRVGYKGQEDFILTSGKIPLFNGDVYSILIRQNSADLNFDINDISNIPLTYDFIVQSNLGGNVVLSTSSSFTCYDTSINNKFSNLTIPYSAIVMGGWFNSWNSTALQGAVDKLEIYQNPISNDTFSNYVNNINSYSNDISHNYTSLLYRMHVDYPFNISSSTTWPNANTTYPSALQNYNGWYGISTASYDTSSCSTSRSPIYPYQFKIIKYPNTVNFSAYGPNQFYNEKVNNLSQYVYSRLDNTSTSATNIEQLVPSSNQIGIFLDPQDFKNKDILRQFGNYDLMGFIGDPSLKYNNEYLYLRQLRAQYVKSQPHKKQRTLFNELMTVYRLYFNKSIFETIKKLLPARANIFEGVLIEPTVLERPKYKFQPVTSDLNNGDISYQEIDLSERGLYDLSSSIEYGKNLGINPFDFTVVVAPSGVSTTFPNKSYIPYALDDIQSGVGLNIINNRVIHGNLPSSASYYLLKRWTKFQHSYNNDIYLQNTGSLYLYDYIIVTDKCFYDLVYTSSIVNTDPALGVGPTWLHYPNTFKNTPNAAVNNYALTQYQATTTTVGYRLPSIFIADNVYYEIVTGYPRNHLSHKRHIFSAYTSFNSKHKTTYRSSQWTISGSTRVISGSYPTISSSMDVGILENSNIPVYILTQDAVGILD